MSPHPRIQATLWVESADAKALAPPRALTKELTKKNPVAAQPELAFAPPAAPARVLTNQPAPGALPEQLWLALHLPQIVFDACYVFTPPSAALAKAGAAAAAVTTPDAAVAQPRVVIDREVRPPRVLIACPLAQQLGVQPGMSLSAALACTRDLQIQPRAVRRERLLLETLAGGGFAFTSWVSLEPPDALLLEVRGSLRLFGGEAALLAAVRERSLRSSGVQPALALAPTPLAALVLARAAGAAPRAGSSRMLAASASLAVASAPTITDAALLVGRLAPLPLSLLRWSPDLLERLATLGVRSIGEALRLPRAGFARRFGKTQLLALDQLVGRLRAPRAAFVPRERFVARCEPSYELTQHDAVLRATEPLLAQLEQFLRQRQSGVMLLALTLRHRPPPGALRGEGVTTRIALRLAAPELAAQRFTALLAERLTQTALPAVVIAIELRTGAGTPFAPGSDALWRPGEHGGAAGREAPAFLERLRARLGNEAVYGLCLVPAHRPEAAWGVAEPRPPAVPTQPQTPTQAQTQAQTRAPASSSAHQGRPLWLLRSPAPLDIVGDELTAAGLSLLAGPERIETGWWDGNDALRDYYIARDTAGAELWLYRERAPPHRWFLQGLFG